MAFINWMEPLIGALCIASLRHATDSNLTSGSTRAVRNGLNYPLLFIKI